MSSEQPGTSRRPAGVICPLATPLTDDETTDEGVLRRLVDHLVPDLDGLLVLGSSAEYALLRPEVAEAVVDIALDQVAGRVPVYVGIGDTGTSRAVANATRLWRPGVAAFAVTSGFYYPSADQSSLVRHFTEVSANVGAPVLLYNIPQNTAGNLDASSFARLADHDNIIGIKDSWGDFIQFQAYLDSAPDDFAVLQGREELTAAARWMGGAGVVSALANVAPRLLRAVIEAVDRADVAGARRAQHAVDRAAQLFATGHWLTSLKAAIAELGFGTGRSARPLPEAGPDQLRRIRDILQANDLAPSTGGQS